MQNQCQDNFSTTFTTYGEMQLYHEQLAKDSQWQRCKVSDLHVEPLDRKSGRCSAICPHSPWAPVLKPLPIRQKTLGHAISVEARCIRCAAPPTKPVGNAPRPAVLYFPNLAVRNWPVPSTTAFALFSSEALILSVTRNLGSPFRRSD